MTMVIYGEVLFLENALTGGLLLWMTKKICGLELSRRPHVLGAVCCGIYAFTLFQGEIHLILSLAEKLVFSAVMILVVFGKQRFLLSWIVFYAVSFLMGGITMGLAGLFSIPAVSVNGSFYMEQMSYLHIFCGCGATVLIVYLFLDLIRDQRYRLIMRKDVTIIYKGKKVDVEGFWDTGNRLMDPVTGYPVCLISPDLWKELGYGGEILRTISYSGPTGEVGVLTVCEAEELWIGDGERKRRSRAMLGIASEGEGKQRWGGCDVLLNGLLAVETLGDCFDEIEGEIHENHEDVEKKAV